MNIPPQPLIEEFIWDPRKNAAERWTLWKRRMELFFEVNDITEDRVKLAYVLLYGGSKLSSIYDMLSTEDENDSDYTKSMNLLDNYFLPMNDTLIEEIAFSQQRQEKSETIGKYVSRLRTASRYCGFANQNREIIKQVIMTCNSAELRREFLMTVNLDLDKLLNIARAHEFVKGLSKNNLNQIESREKEDKEEKVRQNRNKKSENEKKCYKCGGNYPHDGHCPANGKHCYKCGETNHFARRCKAN